MHLSRLAALSACLALGACNTQTLGTSANNLNVVLTTTFPSLATIEGKIQAGIAKTCGSKWLPYADTVAGLASLLSGNVSVQALDSAVSAMVKSTCATVLAEPANTGLGLMSSPLVPTYKGVPLMGKFR